MILVFNKTDVQSADFAKDWMTDFEAFQAALQKEEETGTFGGMEGTTGGPAVGGSGYMSSLLNSMSLVLEEFYKHLSVVGVSSLTGAGIPEFFAAVDEKAEEFERDYKPELERRRREREKDKESKREKEMGRLMKDLHMENEPGSIGRPTRRPREEPETVSDAEDMEDDEDGEGELLDPDDNDENNEDNDDGGLTQRYQEALTGRIHPGPSGDDMSFARYVKSGKTNG